MPERKLLNESTEVPAEHSVAEIVKELVGAGAIEVRTQYREGRVGGLAWVMVVAGKEWSFAMPARVEAVHRILRARIKGHMNSQQLEAVQARAERVAWRHLYRWVQAQVAMVRTGMMAPAEMHSRRLGNFRPGSPRVACNR